MERGARARASCRSVLIPATSKRPKVDDAGVATPPTPARPLVRNRRLASQLVTERDKTKTTRLKMSAKKAKKY